MISYENKIMLRTLTLIIFFLPLSSYIFASGGNNDSQLLDFVWKVVNVVVLVAIIYRFAKKPVSEALQNNATTAKQMIDNARDDEERIASSMKEMRLKISGLENEALEMVKSAKKDAEQEKKRIIEEGIKEIHRMTEQAGFALKQESRKAEDELRKWIAEESIKLAEKKLKTDINQTHQKKLINNFIDNLKKPQESL